MIKVTDNGVPLSAIVSVEIDERGMRNDRVMRAMRKCHVRSISSLVYTNRRPKIALSDADFRAIRAEFLKEWPEVAALFTKK